MEALTLLASVAEQAEALSNSRAAAAASADDKDVELAALVCNVVEQYVGRTCSGITAASSVVVSQEALLQLAALVAALVRQTAAASSGARHAVEQAGRAQQLRSRAAVGHGSLRSSNCA